MKVMPASELEESEDDDILLWRGEPFTGICYEQDEDGRIWSISGYLEGEPHGPQRVWRPDGRPLFERYFSRWRRHGPYREWNDEGELREDAYYDRGVLLRERKWDEVGRLRREFLLMKNGPKEKIEKLETRRCELANLPVIDIEDWQFIERPEGWGNDDVPPKQRARPRNLPTVIPGPG